MLSERQSKNLKKIKWKIKFTQLLGISCLGIWWQVCELLTGTAADEQTLILRSTQQSVIRIDYSHNLLPRQRIRCVWCEPDCCLPRIWQATCRRRQQTSSCHGHDDHRYLCMLGAANFNQSSSCLHLDSLDHLDQATTFFLIFRYKIGLLAYLLALASVEKFARLPPDAATRYPL